MNTRLARIAGFVVVIVVLAIVPFAGAQEGPTITVSLTPYEGNPILTVGEAGAWDSGGTDRANVIYHDNVFHMFYAGYTADLQALVPAIGYATSEDGFHWTKYESNPVFLPDESIAPYGVWNAFVILDGETWVMYFNPIIGPSSPSREILRATAPAPTGPWTVEPEAVLESSTARDWDYGCPEVDTVLRTDDGYVLYYTPAYILVSPSYGVAYMSTGGGIGRATSFDGIHWIKYDDPATTGPRFSLSDPVFLRNADYSTWDWNIVGGAVVRFSDDGWEMFYYGGNGGYWRTGYATSEDGVAWTRSGDVPVVINEDGGGGPNSILVIDDTYYLYHSFITAGSPIIDVSIITGTITRE
jgi:hypothetical protein